MIPAPAQLVFDLPLRSEEIQLVFNALPDQIVQHPTFHDRPYELRQFLVLVIQELVEERRIVYFNATGRFLASLPQLLFKSLDLCLQFFDTVFARMRAEELFAAECSGFEDEVEQVGAPASVSVP